MPNPPEKGEKIRAYHEIAYLADRYRIHLACIGREESETGDARALAARCASVYVACHSRSCALVRAATRFAAGACLNVAYYNSPRLQGYVTGLARRVHLQAAFVYTAVMLPYVPAGLPILLDMVDVDSEKWFQYSEARRPGVLYALEAKRLRRFEEQCVKASRLTVLATQNEADLLSRIIPQAPITYMENGIDREFFDGVARPLPVELAGRPFVAFVGTMDYSPNIEGAVWFAESAFPELRRRVPGLEFFIVGRNPSAKVRHLARREGVRVIGAVPDVRPYLAGARAIVAPLDLARGIQNKVLEALAMGRRVFASEAVCRTFGSLLPVGVVPCASVQDYVEGLDASCRPTPHCDESIRAAACERFSWKRNVENLARGLDCLREEPVAFPRVR